MIDEEEKQKYCEATKCSECTQWHKHCNSECCRTIFLNIKPEMLNGGGRYLYLNPGKMGLSDIKYYKNHDVDYLRGLLRFKKERIEVIGRKVIYFWDCSRLNGNLCLDHPDKKPELCKVLTLDTCRAIDRGFKLTPNCLFKYKSREVKQDD
jgi:hypothetical protein